MEKERWFDYMFDASQTYRSDTMTLEQVIKYDKQESMKPVGIIETLRRNIFKNEQDKIDLDIQEQKEQSYKSLG